MTTSTLYSIGDVVRFVSTFDDEQRFATIVDVDELGRRYAVRYTREQLHDTHELVAHEDVVRYRKQRYDVGDVVELYPHTSHEGPHESDFDAVSPVATIERVETHPYNDDWVVGYAIAERDNDEPERIEHRFVKPGKIARLARESELERQRRLG